MIIFNQTSLNYSHYMFGFRVSLSVAETDGGGLSPIFLNTPFAGLGFPNLCSYGFRGKGATTAVIFIADFFMTGVSSSSSLLS